MMRQLLCSGKRIWSLLCTWLVLTLLTHSSIVQALAAQQLTGAMAGTVRDSSGAVVVGAKVAVVNTATNLTIASETSRDGSYQIPDLPTGTYTVTFTIAGFKAEFHSMILVEGNRTTSVDGKLEVVTIEATVEVTDTPLLNQVDTTTGYVLSQQAINN